MKFIGKEFVQHLVVRTSFFPFTCFYRLFYALSIATSIFFLRKVKGVVAIYLRRSGATGDIVYGLSDIDLLVIIDDKIDDEQNIKVRVRAVFEQLSRVIPLLGTADRELGLYSVLEFFNLYDDYDFYRYWFHEGRQSWKLLFGKDLVKTLPQLNDVELYVGSTEELKAWWLHLISEISGESKYPLYKRKYLWYKAIAETSRVCLFVCYGKKVQTRESALNEIKKYLTSEQQSHINQTLDYRKCLTSRENIISDELWQLFVELVQQTFNQMENKIYGTAEGKEAILQIHDNDNIAMGEKVNSKLRELTIYLQEELASFIDYVVLVPRVDFDLEVLDNPDIDSHCLVLVQRSIIPLEKLRKIYSLFLKPLESHNIEAFIMNKGNVAFSMSKSKSFHCIKSPRRYPLFFSLVQNSAFKLSGYTSTNHLESFSINLTPILFEETIKKRTAKINTLIADKNIYKLRTLEFYRFFWSAARTKVLIHSLRNDRIYIPLNSRQILDMLILSFPAEADWLHRLHLEYTRDLKGLENDAHRFFPQAISLLNRI